MSDTETTSNTSHLGIRIDNDERAKIKQAAAIEHRTESGFARFYLIKFAEQVLHEHTEKGGEA